MAPTHKTRFALFLATCGIVGLVACTGSSGIAPSGPWASVLIQPGPAAMVSDANGNAPTSASTELFIKRGTCTVPFRASCKLVAPSGRATTLADWIGVDGVIFFRCAQDGTAVQLFATKLIPDGVYTVWVSGGPLGASDGSQNSFRADPNGVGQLGMTAGPSCLQSGGSVLIAYHNDKQTHGAIPGTPDTWAAQGQLLVP